MSDIETIRKKLEEAANMAAGEFGTSEAHEQAIRDGFVPAFAALDRLVAERDRLREALEQLLRASGFFSNDPDDNIAIIGLNQAKKVARAALSIPAEQGLE